MDEKETHKLFSELGYIRKWLENIDRRLAEQNGHVAQITKKVNRHEMFIGKLGAVTSMIAFTFSIVITLIINAWFRFWKS